MNTSVNDLAPYTQPFYFTQTLWKSLLCCCDSLTSNLDSYFTSKTNAALMTHLTPPLSFVVKRFGYRSKFLERLSLNDCFWYLMIVLSLPITFFPLRFALNQQGYFYTQVIKSHFFFIPPHCYFLPKMNSSFIQRYWYHS